jgi:hypothetical protein
MGRKEIEEEIAKQLHSRKGRVLNRNAIDALFLSVSNPVEALGKVFLGREVALEAEQHRIQQEIILDILCKIEESLNKTREKPITQSDIINIISGEIEAHGYDADEVIGLLITSDAGPTELKLGTHIKVKGKGSKKVTGLQIGNRPN